MFMDFTMDLFGYKKRDQCA